MNSSQLDPDSRADLAQRALNLLDAGEVIRFHAVPTITGQTVGQHSYGVAAILVALGMMVDPEDRWVVSNAILHDAAELITGDMPFTVKRSSPEAKTMMDQMELVAEMSHFLPQTRLSKRQILFLKLADMLEGLRWCLVGHERGNPIVAGRWAAAIDQMIVDGHQHFLDGEGERVWAVYRAIKAIQLNPQKCAPGLLSCHSTLKDFLVVHVRKPRSAEGLVPHRLLEAEVDHIKQHNKEQSSVNGH